MMTLVVVFLSGAIPENPSESRNFVLKNDCWSSSTTATAMITRAAPDATPNANASLLARLLFASRGAGTEGEDSDPLSDVSISRLPGTIVVFGHS
jgi:hypothetical protein